MRDLLSKAELEAMVNDSFLLCDYPQYVAAARTALHWMQGWYDTIAPLTKSLEEQRERADRLEEIVRLVDPYVHGTLDTIRKAVADNIRKHSDITKARDAIAKLKEDGVME